MASKKEYRILVVDDIADNSFLLTTFLESEGYTVDVATSGKTAFQKMQSHPPDLVMLDVMMPDMNGYELTRKIRHDSQLRSIPVVLVTAHIQSCRIKGIAVGATDFIYKPIDLSELGSRLERILQHQNARSAYEFFSPPTSSA
ncbi:MAG TPA: response regulator [Trichocoleus sp.]